MGRGLKEKLRNLNKMLVANEPLGNSPDKPVYNPIEFGERFGKSKWWTYRLARKDLIRVISKYGTMMVPHSEAEKIENDKERYLGRKKKRANHE